MDRAPLIAAVLAMALARGSAADGQETDADWLVALRRSRDALEWSDTVVRHD